MTTFSISTPVTIYITDGPVLDSSSWYEEPSPVRQVSNETNYDLDVERDCDDQLTNVENLRVHRADVHTPRRLEDERGKGECYPTPPDNLIYFPHGVPSRFMVTCIEYGKLQRVTRRARLTLNWKGRRSTSFSCCCSCCCCREVEDGIDDDGFSRRVAMVSALFRLEGTGPTSVTLDAAPGVATAREEDETACPAEVAGESAKGRVILPYRFRKRWRSVPLRLRWVAEVDGTGRAIDTAVVGW